MTATYARYCRRIHSRTNWDRTASTPWLSIGMPPNAVTPLTYLQPHGPRPDRPHATLLPA